MSKKTIFFIHGFSTGAWIWDDYKKRFEGAGYDCIAPDLPYHGVSQEHPPEQLAKLGIADYADFLEEEIAKLNSPPIVIAHSAGTLMAQILAMRGVLSSVVLLCPVPPAGITFINKDLNKVVGSVLRTWRFWRKPVRPTFEELVFSAMHLCSEEEQRRVYSRFCHESGRTYKEILLAAVSPWSPIRIDETKVTCPMLVVAGTEDRMSPSHITQRIAAKYGADYVELPDHAHWPCGEPGWEDFLDTTLEWIAKQE